MNEKRENTDVNYDEKYIKEGELDRGGFGVVYKVREKKTGNLMAIKTLYKEEFNKMHMNKHLMMPNEDDMNSYMNTCLKEIQNMKEVEGKNGENDNTVKFIEFFETPKGFNIVMELCDENLFNYIAKKKEALNDEEIYDILSQLNNIFRIMAAKKIAHRDLKLENILIKYDPKDKKKFTCKLTDFGESKKLAITRQYTQVGTCRYTAPEILDNKNYNIECDLWSLGIIIYFLSFKNFPYNGQIFAGIKKQINDKVIDKIINQQLNNYRNQNISSLIRRLLTKDPKKRMTWVEYLRHPFFTDRDFRNYYQLGERIGGGGFGEVFEAKLKRNNKARAIKIMNKKRLRDEIKKEKIREPNNDDMKPYIDGFYNEITIMEMIEGEKDNDNTVKFYEFYNTEKEFVIVMELCDENLLQFISKRNKNFSIGEIYDLLTQLNNSFKLMVKNQISHRDLKLENILIKYKNKEKTKYEVKLTDYGISKKLLTLSQKFTTKIGTDAFMAPEVRNGEYYNQECDLWSIGVIIHILLFRKFPNKDNELKKIQINLTGNEDIDDLLGGLLTINPEQRIKWNDYFNHSFFKSYVNTTKDETIIEKENQIIINIVVRNHDKINNEFKDMYFLECNYYYENNIKKYFKKDNEENGENEEINNLNDTNTKIYINDEPVAFCKFFKPTQAGNYKIKIIFKKLFKNCKFMFRNCTNIVSIDLSRFDSSNVDNMNYMFGRCFELKEINMSNLNTEKVTDMGYMFNKCKNLTKIILPPSFITKNVTNMAFMFHFCTKLQNIMFPNSFITDNVTNMYAMFGKCNTLTKLDLRKFNTNKVEDMSYMFDQCFNLEEILIDHNLFKTNNVKSMGHMFNECSNLKNFDLSFLDIGKVIYLCYMFSECDKLSDLDLSKLNFKEGVEINMTCMFNKCINLKKLNLSSFLISDNFKIEKMLSGLDNIEKIIVNKNSIQNLKEKFNEIKSKFSIY